MVIFCANPTYTDKSFPGKLEWNLLSSYGGGADVLFASSLFGIRFVVVITDDRDFKTLFTASKTSKTIQSNIPKIVAKLIPRTRPAAPPTSDKYCSQA